MKLNCDLGESFGAWTMGRDEDVMPLIDMANVACGFHASDPTIMHRTVELAVSHNVVIGAHPAYLDLHGFGRRSIPHTAEQVRALIWYQVGALQGICRAHGATVQYVKPHGALNNDMMRDDDLLQSVMDAIATYDRRLSLMMPVTTRYEAHQSMADERGLSLILEAFADRAYDDEGQLVSRREPNAVHHDPDKIVRQAVGFAEYDGVESHSGQWLTLPATSLCVHGDNEQSLAAVRSIRDALGTRRA
ncbi:UPF0271 protein [Tamilnaduibacter salinus]|uniref:UPF0271 protein n=1 Tax=Tamilnaduibacter salinus TaxID=1484056 RepID=A0A2A2I1I3_9GAMM|nr:5-oxoprolinase subunit PxpA [Tamilnaduibacter salinus]PAV25144.1 hypothetical protein CF392_12490 [Tamilnaduibacter salinus]PVY78054.1 UPF0271 protein [Tamilnaduibacter salinus]